MKAADSFRFRFSKSQLRDVFEERISSSGSIGIDRVRAAGFSSRADEEIDLILSRVWSGRYRFTPYKEKLVSKGAGAPPRQVSIPTVRDRVVLRALCDCLGDVFPDRKLKLPHVVIDSLKEALTSGIYSEFVKIDIQGFYPSLRHKMIMSSIWARARKRELRALIEAAIKVPTVSAVKGGAGALPNPVGIPQGLAISNILAEVAMEKLDRDISSLTDIWASRYVDDILILTRPGKAQGVADYVISRLRQMGLKAHPPGPGSKTVIGPLGDPFGVLGYWVDGEKLLVRRESVLRFESSLAKILTAYRYKVEGEQNKEKLERAFAYCKWKLNLRITGCVFEGKRLGWVAYFSQITSTSQLRAIHSTLDSLLKRFGLDEKIKPKSLIKTFYELRRVGLSSTYIPNFDQLTISQKRDRLTMWIGARVNKLSDEEVDRLLSIKLAKAVRDLEADIAQTS